ncbi:hypothetical protein GCM10010531_31150 [Blastococcus jejuensis]|uniref:Uncharacterized protein n=1 Tax=Blastococcus jejuensis TaxID=351224 RepID=A0ABP6PFP5_9ACTN
MGYLLAGHADIPGERAHWGADSISVLLDGWFSTAVPDGVVLGRRCGRARGPCHSTWGSAAGSRPSGA